MSAGMQNVTEEIIFQVVSIEEYKTFMYSYTQRQKCSRLNASSLFHQPNFYF